MEAIDLEVAHAVGGGITIDSWLAALIRDGWLERQGIVMPHLGDDFG